MAKLIIEIDKETRRPVIIIEQIFMIKELRALYDKYGTHGVYYAILFFWETSPYISQTDLSLRHKMVYENTFKEKLKDFISAEWETSNVEHSVDKGYFKDKIFENAGLVINTLGGIEDLRIINAETNRIKDAQGDLYKNLPDILKDYKSGKFDYIDEKKGETKRDTIDKVIASITKYELETRKIIDACSKNIREAEARISKKMSAQSFASLNDLMSDLDAELSHRG